MNAEEMKIGMYTEDEIFQYMTEQEGGMLGRSMYDAIFDKMHALITETEQLKKDNLILKEKLEASEKARKEASNILKDYIPDEYIRSCDTSDGIGRYELDTESWQYKIYEILDIDKGEIINGKY